MIIYEELYIKYINVLESNVHIYEAISKQELQQGYIGTGMKIAFDNHETIYTASVIGDLNADGQINQIEINWIIKHVVGLTGATLKAIDLVSADVSGDGKVDQIDISILIRYIVFGKLELGDLVKPASPIIEIVNGQKGENDWYTSNVVLKITKPETSQLPITNLYCKVIGTVEIEETEILDGNTITIEEEGIYELTAYSVDYAGNESKEETVEIYLDTTAPIAGTMNMYINNKEGEVYVNNEWTNQSVYAEPVDGNDNLSGHSTTVYKVTG